MLRRRRPPIDSETPIVQIRKPQIRIVFSLRKEAVVVEETLGNPRAMVKKKDKDMTDQEMGMMYLKAAHSVRIYIYKWVLTDPSPNNFHLKNL